MGLPIGLGLAWLAFDAIFKEGELKSDNLQYNTLDYWSEGPKNSSTKHLMFQVLFFFIISFIILCKNSFNFFLLFFYNFTKIKSFECPKSKPANHCFIFNLSINQFCTNIQPRFFPALNPFVTL